MYTYETLPPPGIVRSANLSAWLEVSPSSQGTDLSWPDRWLDHEMTINNAQNGDQWGIVNGCSWILMDVTGC